MEEILHQLRLVLYPIIFKVWYIPGGCFGISKPSTVSLYFFRSAKKTQQISELRQRTFRPFKRKRSDLAQAVAILRYHLASTDHGEGPKQESKVWGSKRWKRDDVAMQLMFKQALCFSFCLVAFAYLWCWDKKTQRILEPQCEDILRQPAVFLQHDRLWRNRQPRARRWARTWRKQQRSLDSLD